MEIFMKIKTYRRFSLIILGVTGVIMMVQECKKDTGANPTPPPPLELLYPKGGSGQSFKVGETVTIKWSVHEPQNMSSVGLSYSKDGGKTFPTTQILGTGSVSRPDTTYQWVIDKQFVSDQFVLVIWDYDGQCISGSPNCSSKYHDKSAAFAIHE
jgi:hypothetical protein